MLATRLNQDTSQEARMSLASGSTLSCCAVVEMPHNCAVQERSH